MLQLSATCVTLLDDDSAAYTGSKDGSIVRWDMATGARTVLSLSTPAAPGASGARAPRAASSHSSEILCLTSSSDGRYLVSGGRDNFVRVWDTRTNAVVRSFSGHRDAVTCVAFRKNSKTVRECYVYPVMLSLHTFSSLLPLVVLVYFMQFIGVMSL
jgi:ribosomal RNA-processing protein 9